MWYLSGSIAISGRISWDLFERLHYEEEGIRIAIYFYSFRERIKRRDALRTCEDSVQSNNISWLIPGEKEWEIDLDKLVSEIPQINNLKWAKGRVFIEPEYETEEETFSNTKIQYRTAIAFYITQKEVNRINMKEFIPAEIKESLDLFKKDYPDSSKVAFIMMKFGNTTAHDNIVQGIKQVLKSYDIIGLRADDKQYHDDLFPNVLTYIYGCKFGIAIFERIEAEEFNPNVSLEVGYMLALKKPVCLLKDKTLKTLHTDLVGKLYKVFDPLDPINSIPVELKKWLEDKGLI